VGIVATKLTSRHSLPLPAEFCRRLVERYLFHVYDSIGGGRQGKKDPRLAKGALHLAASEGQLEVVRYLLAREVDVNPLYRWGGTPLDDAHRENRQAVAELLASHGAQLGATLLPASVELAAALA
jgi:hypothetical protein